MRKIFSVVGIVLIFSCCHHGTDNKDQIITVSIAPFKYFIKEIAGDDFKVNVMVTAGADPHIYEPFPGQLNKLRKSVAFISDGYLGFEMTWLDRFYETNRVMKRLSLGDKIDLIISGNHPEGVVAEGADPHFWVAPKCAMIIALSIKDFLSELNPVHKQIYEENYKKLVLKIKEVDKKAFELFSGFQNSSFFIFHPTLGYLARDYGLIEVPVEFEGKEPPLSKMKELIDLAREDGIRTIFVQREYDTKNARAIANEIGAELRIIDPLSEEWLKATMDIISALHMSLIERSK